MTLLPQAFLDLPIAHRAYHNCAERRPENSRAAFQAAITAGYGIECDVQLSADGQAVVFHDYTLNRLTKHQGRIRDLTVQELAAVPQNHTDETIPTLAEMLDLTQGCVPLLVEIKDQDGQMGPDVGRLEQAVANDLRGYDGPVAVMSFNPHSIEAFGRFAPDIPRGLTTSAYDPEVWGILPSTVCDRLRDIPDYGAVGASFISHEAGDLSRARVAELKRQNVPILTWTIRSAEAEATARKIADNITFEDYPARI